MTRIKALSEKVTFFIYAAIMFLLIETKTMSKFPMRFLTPEEVLFKSQDPLIFEIKACYEINKCEVKSFYSRIEARNTIEVLKTVGINYTVCIRLPSNNAIKKLGTKVFD